MRTLTPPLKINSRGSACSALNNGPDASNRTNDGSDAAVTNSNGATPILFSFHRHHDSCSPATPSFAANSSRPSLLSSHRATLSAHFR
jgi:hypothetical protein